MLLLLTVDRFALELFLLALAIARMLSSHLDAPVPEGGANRLESPIHTSYAREEFDSSQSKNSEEAEALSVIRGMEAAHKIDIERALVLTNCRRLVWAYETRTNDLSWDALAVAPEMLALSSSFSEFSFQFFSRSFNSKAHALTVLGVHSPTLSLNEPDEATKLIDYVVSLQPGEGFYKLRGLKLPDSPYFFVNKSRVSAEREFSEGGQDLYIRLAASEFGKQKDARIIILSVVLTTILISGLGYLFWKWRTKQRGNKNGVILCNTSNDTSTEFAGSNMLRANPELPIFNFEKLVIATDNFSVDNKLGRDGFGSVYKGKFPDGQEIAVKRLSKRSGQGSEEFMNEVVVISKLQHRNLVRLVGSYIEVEEKMLVYEYQPNKGLDSFLFDPKKQSLLDWRKRFQIIEGIGRGTLYLPRDSRLRVIHRDLKASNILLDEELNPKISDFGMARIFGGNEVQANTRRVVGTYAYMSPRYAMKGRFSEKSDVFSFGVLLLEIVSGKRNSSFSDDDESPSLLGYAWELWNEDNIRTLIDPGLSKPSFQEEILRCIHVGLLCVQDFIEDRPSMSIVLSMLTSEMVHLPPPKQPAFMERHISSDFESREKIHKSGSIKVSITEVHGR
ncbi:hypothetical protein GIB67_015647 [Kingdonia uniflora]|uniref:non-specific serine/threonine protein kinase n=1 Tax=Kingdonia uniflora TaxID=39325 RepID=A0A7J7NU03_9MAGN|nr:hypothetical protein GIB67_015647 [Kingdonia uniflora]